MRLASPGMQTNVSVSFRYRRKHTRFRPVLPTCPDLTTRGLSFDGTLLQNPDAGRSNEGHQSYRRRAPPVAGSQGYETAARRSMSRITILQAPELSLWMDAIQASPSECPRGGDTEITQAPQLSGPIQLRRGS